MSDFQAFDSIEDMFTYMHQQEEQANQRLSPEQQAVTYGDYWCRFYDITDRVVIFGRVMTEAEMREAETALESEDDPPGETEAILDRLSESHQRGYMYGRCFSTIEPDGEWGSTHKFNLWPISRELYEVAREVKWNIDELPPTQRLELEAVYQVWRAHLTSLGGSPVQ